jgi:hypothetical protein
VDYFEEPSLYLPGGADENQPIFGLRLEAGASRIQAAGMVQSVQPQATSWTAGVSFPARPRGFLLSSLSRPALGPTRSPIQMVPGAPFPRIKRPGRE